MLNESAGDNPARAASARPGHDSAVVDHVASFIEAGYEITISRPAAGVTEADTHWDTFLEQVPDVYFAQSSLWTKVKAYQKYEALRLAVSRQGQIVAGAQILMRPLTGLGYLGYASRGPVLRHDDPALMSFTLQAMLKATRQAGIGMLIVQPHGHGPGPVDQLRSLGFRPTARSVAPVHTL